MPLPSTSASPASIAWLGLGAMGARIAANLAADGHRLTVWNRTPDIAADFASTYHATTAATPADAVRGAELVVSMVTDDQASHDVWLGTHGALAAMERDAIAIESSTVSVKHARLLADTFERHGRSMVEAPVVGSRPQAEQRQLVVLAGGDSMVIDKIEPVLSTIAAAVYRVGPVGAAAALKLTVNGLLAMQAAAFAEALSLLGAAAIDTEIACNVIRTLPITSPAMQRMTNLMQNGTFAPNFTIDLVAKDLGYLLDLAHDHNSASSMIRAAHDRFRQSAVDLGGLDISAIIQAR